MVFTRFFAIFAKRKCFNLKMMLRWSQGAQNPQKLVPKRVPRAAKKAPRGPMLAYLAALRRHVGAFWGSCGHVCRILSAIFEQDGQNAKTTTPHTVLAVFSSFEGVSCRPSWSLLGLYCVILAPSCANMESL